MAKVLIVDDEELIRDSFSMALERSGYQVLTAESGQEGLGLLVKHHDLDCVVSDIKMPGMDGLELLVRIKENYSRLPVIIISAHASPDDAARAMKLGALDFFSKPFTTQEIEARIAKAVEHHALAEENESLRQTLKFQKPDSKPFVSGNKGVMAELKTSLERIALSDSTILIQGESGTGKEVVARYIHQHSKRKDKLFLAVNCAALSAGLLESELFGHEKGAFTGADQQRKGRFELARGGTLLLDEVSEIDINLQAKLLRVLQEKSFERVGSSQSIKADVRVLATTNRDLESAVRAGSFREDLYFRLNVIPVILSPLRERQEDLPLLVEHFIQRYALDSGKEAPRIDESGIKVLKDYSWPGNVRELENLIERLLILVPGKNLKAEDIEPYLSHSRKTEPSFQGASDSLRTSKEGKAFTLQNIPASDENKRIPSIESMEKHLILFAMEELKGDKKAIAEALGITTKTLRTKLKKFEVEV